MNTYHNRLIDAALAKTKGHGIPRDRWILVIVKKPDDSEPPVFVVKWNHELGLFDPKLDYPHKEDREIDEITFPIIYEHDIVEWFNLPAKGTGNAR